MVDKGFEMDLVRDEKEALGWRIKAIHINSDNAGQHFKSTGAMNMFCEYRLVPPYFSMR